MASKVRHVVADAGAFIRNAPLQEIAENIYTVPEVIAESCDRATRRRLQTFPLDIKFKEPSGDSILLITAFAKRTGDYSSLSAVDLKVLALTYDLEKQFKGVTHLRKEPAKNPEWAGGAQSTTELQKEASYKQYKDGEVLPSNQIGEPQLDDDSDEDDFFDAEQSLDTVNCEGDAVVSQTKDSSDGQSNTNNTDITEASAVEDESQDSSHINEEMEDADDSEEEDDDDDEGWITPANIKEVKRSMGIDAVEAGQVCVGCLTTDFAMQNVLIQMGLNVLSVDGMLIKRAKSYVLRCFGCMRITKNTEKKFCPHCGNATLKKLSTTIEADGSVRYWLARNFIIRTRGTKFSLPKPQGGKHAVNPLLCADQPMPHQRPTKRSMQRVDVLSADIIADANPFKTNDVTSRAAQLGIRGRDPPLWAKRNPNEGRKKGNKRKGK